eukprot:TRINITY_DN1069_c0_g2_i1.p1 TRINITY_DN1069_c0_g2~~TRINITY_DN1069_c0_g2_i1.p1  ORF type:complete len:327 (+),score=96.23 TRINITY_DN1069_c0_g2_i1:289-1269(+)
MTTYGFNVTIQQPDLGKLVSGGFNLGVQKSTLGSQPLQWLGIPLLAGNIQVRYTADYQVFFTTTLYQSGAVIMESQYSSTNMGDSWSYSPATSFTRAVMSPPVGGTSTAVQNNLGGYASFGLAQSASVNGSSPTFSPLAVVPPMPNGGVATFTPSQTLNLYFVYNTVTNGTVATGQTTPYTLTLQANVFPTLVYFNSNWTQPQPAAAMLGSALAAPVAAPLYRTLEAGPVRKFQLALSYPIPKAAVEEWLTDKFKARVHVARDSGSKLEIIVGGRGELPPHEDLVYEKVDQTRVAPSIVEKRVHEVRIIELEEQHDLETFLANKGK